MQRFAYRIVALACFACCFVAGPRSAVAGVVQRQLNQTLPEVQFDGVAIRDAVDFLRNVTGTTSA